MAMLCLAWGAGTAQGGVVAAPIDPAQGTSLPYGTRSFWRQPWRGWMDTWPAARLRRGLGINFNVDPGEAGPTAKLLAASGFSRARVEIGWNTMSFDDPSRIAPNLEAGVRAKLAALRDNGLRPLILLNSNQGEPTPSKVVPVSLALPALVGTKSVAFNRASVASIVPGRSGFDFGGVAAGVIVTSVTADGTAQLSRPLPGPLTAGAQQLRVLTAEPFAAPVLPSGASNPRFERTLGGWLTYVKGVTSFAKSVLGSDNYDVEIWNELGFGSAFLNQGAYYAAPTEPGASGSVTDTLLARTTASLRDPANGVSGVRIGDGFTNQAGLVAGSELPVGVTAMDKHPYQNGAVYPAGVQEGTKPVDALGVPNFSTVAGRPRDTFVPTYRSFFPEHFLNQTDAEGLGLLRDLGPTLTPGFRGVLHGRASAPPGGTPPEMWITEYNLNGSVAKVFSSPSMSDDELDQFRAKVALRAFAGYLGKGATQVDLFAAKGGEAWQLIPQRFFDAVKARPTQFPSVDPGPVMTAVGRLAAAMAGPETLGTPRSLTLDRIADTHDHFQFEGNNTAAFPKLYNRERLAFFPFQANNHRFVVPVYVMTTDLSRSYQANAPAGTPGRFDLPEEAYEITIGGLDGKQAAVTYADPVTGREKAATITGRTPTTITVSLAATDSPRLLTITDGVDAPTVASLTTLVATGAGALGSYLGPKPKVKIRKTTRRSLVKRGLRLRLKCPRACAAGFALSPRSTPKAILATQFGKSTAARFQSFKVDLGRVARRWFARHRRPKLILFTAVFYDNGTIRLVKRGVPIKRHKAKRGKKHGKRRSKKSSAASAANR